MPTVMTDGQILETVVRCWNDYQAGNNVRHWRVTGVTGYTVEDFADFLESELVPLYTAVLSTEAIVDAIKVRGIGEFPTETVTKLIGLPGTISSPLMARQVSLTATLKTGLGGRYNRGRMYMPFPNETDNGPNGRPTDVYRTFVSGIAQFYVEQKVPIVDTRTAIIDPVLWHHDGGTATVLTTWLTRDKWGTQKRRGSWGKLEPRLSVG